MSSLSRTKFLLLLDRTVSVKSSPIYGPKFDVGPSAFSENDCRNSDRLV